jgi:hypothetical protein
MQAAPEKADKGTENESTIVLMRYESLPVALE